jgi:protein O-GlcNAc transferase
MEATIASTADMMREGLAHHKAGRLSEAAAIYELVLAADPTHADAHHLVGLIALQRGDHQSAADKIQQAIALNSSSAVYYSNLGVALRALRRPVDAVAALRRGAQLDATSADIALNLGRSISASTTRRFSPSAGRSNSIRKRPRHGPAWAKPCEQRGSFKSLAAATNGRWPLRRNCPRPITTSD